MSEPKIADRPALANELAAEIVKMIMDRTNNDLGAGCYTAGAIAAAFVNAASASEDHRKAGIALMAHTISKFCDNPPVTIEYVGLKQ